MNQTMENLGSFILIIAVFLIFAEIVKATFGYILKKRLIELGRLDENSLKVLAKQGQSTLQNLKWAMLCFFGGLGLVIIQFLPYKGEDSPLPYGVESIFLAIGFFLYYIVARKQQNNG